MVNINDLTERIGFTDLALASYLSLNFPILELSTQDGVKYEFIFLKSTQLEESISEFYSNKAQVNPLSYFNAIKNLKGRIYSRN
jgi:hypothetical protein